LALLLTFSSCQKYLDVKPKSQIKETALFETERGFVDALAGIYTQMAKRPLYGDILTLSFLDVLAQRYKIGTQSSPYWDASQYNYDSNISGLQVKTTLREIWLSMYAGIANVNNLLAHIDEKQTLFIGENYNLVKGEALAVRAFLHFDLLRMYGPMFDRQPDAVAIPYRTVVSREKQNRQTASEVIALIITDLEEAERLLENDPIYTLKANEYVEFTAEYRRYRMNIVAVQGTLARVLLYAGRTEQAYIYANKVIDSDFYTFVLSGDISAAGACRDRSFRFEHLFALKINNMKEYTDEYFNAVSTTFEDRVLSNDASVINAVFENSSTDYRRQYLWESRSGQLLHSKFWQLDDDRGVCNWDKNQIPLLRVSEMFYIAAETAPTVSEGLAYLNTVRGNRGIDPIIGVNTSQQLQNELTKEYQKEFFSEGQLFYYYKRQGFTQIPMTTIAANDVIYVLPIPEEELIF
jgi:hypothetical protein